MSSTRAPAPTSRIPEQPEPASGVLLRSAVRPGFLTSSALPNSAVAETPCLGGTPAETSTHVWGRHSMDRLLCVENGPRYALDDLVRDVLVCEVVRLDLLVHQHGELVVQWSRT